MRWSEKERSTIYVKLSLLEFFSATPPKYALNSLATTSGSETTLSPILIDMLVDRVFFLRYSNLINSFPYFLVISKVLVEITDIVLDFYYP